MADSKRHPICIIFWEGTLNSQNKIITAVKNEVPPSPVDYSQFRPRREYMSLFHFALRDLSARRRAFRNQLRSCMSDAPCKPETHHGKMWRTKRGFLLLLQPRPSWRHDQGMGNRYLHGTSLAGSHLLQESAYRHHFRLGVAFRLCAALLFRPETGQSMGDWWNQQGPREHKNMEI